MCEQKGVSLIGDKSMFFASTESFPRHLFQGDKVHLNEKGVGVLVASIKRHLSPDRRLRPPKVMKVNKADTPPRQAHPPQHRQPEARGGQLRRQPRLSQASDQPSDIPAGAQRSGVSESEPRDRGGHCPPGATTAQTPASVVTPPFSGSLPIPQANSLASPPFVRPHAVHPNPMFMFNPANQSYHFMGMSPFMHPHQGGPLSHPRYVLVQ